jgi:outer membrane protein
MKKILLSICILSVISVGLKAQVKIAYMNPNAVLFELDEVASIEQQIEALVNQRDQEILAKAGQLQQAISDYDAIRLTLSPAEQKVKEEELLQKNQELEQERNSYLNEVRQRRAQLLAPVMEEMDVAIKKIATNMNIDLVLNEGTSYGDAIVFYASEERLNITDMVIAELKSE